MDLPKTRYAKIGEDHVAYQVFGDGPIDVVPQIGWVSHIEAMWDIPAYARYLQRFATFARVIIFDVRGTGLSDPVPLTSLPTLEEWMDDARVVLDAAGSEHAAFVASGDAGPFAMVFAATHPERTSALVLTNSYARLTRAEGYPWGAPQRIIEMMLEHIRGHWGSGALLRGRESWASDKIQQEEFGRYERQAAAPRSAVAQHRVAFEVDVRDILSSIRAPTLIIHARDAQVFRVATLQFHQFLARRLH